MIYQSIVAAAKKSKDDESKGGKDNNTIVQGVWKKKLKKVVKIQNGFKIIMSILAAEETSNQTMIKASLPSATTPPPNLTESASAMTISEAATISNVNKSFPATSLKLNTILTNGKK